MQFPENGFAFGAFKTPFERGNVGKVAVAYSLDGRSLVGMVTFGLIVS